MLAATALALTIIAFGQVAADDPSFDDLTSGGTYYVDAYQGSGDSGTTGTTASNTSGPPTEYVRAPRCTSTIVRQDQTPTCPNNDPITMLCLDGSEAELPIWFRSQNPDGTWTDWSIVRDYYCPGDAALLAAIQHEWTQLQPQPSDINLEPNTGWVIATVPTIAMAGDAPRVHLATLLGANVEIRATASGYRWEWGDGSHTTTTDPGRPYPHATLTHTYPHAEDAATVALATTWSGEYRVNGGPWIDFDSTISSDSTPVDLVIYDPRSRLVNCDLENNCRIATHG
ncbi:MAG: hypothetical protein NVV57_01305 [Demequina sp.]|nr:hypothetical protein [Demequina sp.]